MPSQQPATQAQGFRTALVGGFDKNDVLAYMNALANETQQHELEYQEQIQQLQAQLEKLRKEQANARVCVETLQSDLAAAQERATAAEQEKQELTVQLHQSEQLANSYQARCKENENSSKEWRFRCRDLEEQMRKMQLAAEEQETTSTEPPVEETPAAPVKPAPAVVPVPESENARIEARKILADARLSAANAERRLQEQASQQKQAMADHARDLAAGVLLLRERLARVDDRLNAATLDLENATAAIYTALDETNGDLQRLGGQLHNFGNPVPAQDSQPPVAAKDGAARAKATPQRVRPVKTAPTPPKPEPRKRLRHSFKRQPVSQELLDALERLDLDKN